MNQAGQALPGQLASQGMGQQAAHLQKPCSLPCTGCLRRNSQSRSRKDPGTAEGCRSFSESCLFSLPARPWGSCSAGRVPRQVDVSMITSCITVLPQFGPIPALAAAAHAWS